MSVVHLLGLSKIPGDSLRGFREQSRFCEVNSQDLLLQ